MCLPLLEPARALAYVLTVAEGGDSRSDSAFIDRRRESLHAALLLGSWIARNLSEASLASGQPVSLRRWAEQAKPPVAFSTLWRAHAIYKLSLRFPEVKQLKHLGVAHLSVVLGARRDQQLPLMRRAERGRWSRRRLQQEAAELKLASKPDAGLKRTAN